MSHTPDQIIAELRRVYRYDPEAGLFWWKERGRGRNTLKPAGSRCSHDRAEVVVFRKKMLASRAAFAYVNGWFPLQVDHKDLDMRNNRILNLRPASASQNAANRKKRTGAAVSVKGVDLAAGRYRAQIKVNGKSIHLGRFDCPNEAGAAYLAAAEKHFGEFARA